MLSVQLQIAAHTMQRKREKAKKLVRENEIDKLQVHQGGVEEDPQSTVLNSSY